VALAVGSSVASVVVAALVVTPVVAVIIGPTPTSVACAFASTIAVTVAETELSTVESISAAGAVGNWVQPVARIRLTARQRARKVLIVDKSFLLILT
jgi:hypothetical protein